MLTGKAANDFVSIQMAATDQKKKTTPNPDVLFLGCENSYTLKPVAVLSTIGQNINNNMVIVSLNYICLLRN